MYVCVECGETFSEPESWVEKHGLSSPPYEEISGCPYCGGAYDDAYPCDCCGEWITGDYIRVNGDRYCEHCYQEYELGEE